MLFFVSSTFKDLQDERVRAQEALKGASAEPWGMEFFASEPTRPLDVCLREVKNCGAVLLIIGHYAGSVIEAAPGMTYTRAEIEEAIKLNRPIFPFIKTEAGKFVNKETDPVKRRALADFKAMVDSAPCTPAYFETLDELKYEVLKAVHRWTELGRPGARQTFAEAAPGHSVIGIRQLFDFDQVLRGREEEMGSLDKFLFDPTTVVGVLPGRGGIGKTKLLREFAAKASGWSPLWVSGTGIWHKETEKEIPSGNVVIIADDGHRFDEMARLISLVDELARTRHVKLLIGARPSGLNWINELVARVLDETRVVRFKALEQLRSKDTRVLAEEVLGADHAALAPALAELSKDTPLVTVVGGRLLARGMLAPAELGNEEGFRRAVLDKFTEECEGLLPSGGRSKRELLHLVSAVQPINPSHDKGFADTASKFIVGLRPDQILQGLNALEEGGIVIRTRGGVRIAPDVLGDYLLESACVNAKGESTGYAQAVFDQFRNPFLGNLLKNLAELDWRIAQKHTESELLDEIWRQLTDEFGKANAADRRFLLNAVEAIVAFQPLRVLEMVRIAIDTQAESAKVLFLTTQEDVLREVPELLGWIAFAPEALAEAVTRLWRLAKQRGRVEEQAQRTLKGLVAYRKYKHVEFNDKMAGLIEELANEPDAFEGSFTPLDLADELLDREVDYTEMNGRSFSFGALPLNYSIVKSVRDRAFRLIERLLSSASAKASTRAARSLGPVLSGFLPKMGRTLTPDEILWHDGERIRAVEIIRARMRKGDAPIPLGRQLRNTLRRLVRKHLDTPVMKAIEEAVEEIPQSDELLLLDALCTGEWDRDIEFDNLELATQHTNQQRQAAVHVLRKLHSAPADQLAEIEKIINQALSFGIEVKGVGEFVAAMLTDAAFLDALETYVAANQESVMGRLAGVVLLQLRLVNRQRFANFGKLMAGSENVAIVGTVAQAVCYGPNLGSPITEDVEILSELVQRTEPGILMTTFSGLARLGRDTRFEEVALSLATQIRLNDDPKLAEEYCEMFATKGLSVNALHRDQVQNILEKLVPVQELNEQGVGAFLSRISGSHPDLLVEFLVKRLERYRELSAGDESTEYETFPLRGIHFNDLRTTPNYESALKRLRDFVLEYPDDWLWAIPLFWAAGTIDDTTLLVLDEWVHSGEEAKLTGVLALLSEAPRGLVVSRPFFAVHLAEEYGRVGLEWERKMIGQLATNSLSIGFGYVGASIPSPFGQAHEKAAELVKCFPVDSPAYRLFAELVANKENWNPPSPVMDGVEIEE